MTSGRSETRPELNGGMGSQASLDAGRNAGVSGARERPILMSATSVRETLAGRMTRARRIVKPQPTGVLGHFSGEGPRRGNWWFSGGPPPFASFERRCPYGVPGDLLWVREAHALIWPDEYAPERIEDHSVQYRADTDGRCLPAGWPDEERGNDECPRWRPSIHMPRWASRITLRVTGVRVERLSDISEADAKAEGLTTAPGGWWSGFEGSAAPSPLAAYALLWNHLHGPGSWDANPWVWVVSLEVVSPPAVVSGEAATPRQVEGEGSRATLNPSLPDPPVGA